MYCGLTFKTKNVHTVHILYNYCMFSLSLTLYIATLLSDVRFNQFLASEVINVVKLLLQYLL